MSWQERDNGKNTGIFAVKYTISLIYFEAGCYYSCGNERGA
jgi:hypothetical protein